MSLLVVGSVAIDSVETPAGRAENAVGGAALYFAVAASFFTPVRMVAAIGDDFPGRGARRSARTAASTWRAWRSVPAARCAGRAGTTRT